MNLAQEESLDEALTRPHLKTWGASGHERPLKEQLGCSSKSRLLNEVCRSGDESYRGLVENRSRMWRSMRAFVVRLEET